ncbi:MAG: ribonuclease HII [Rikenellaceae bacterium]|nr:ribonuclease HII [Rikenellaceae bacterium]
MELTFQDKVLEAGCDEAGRGCLAGPVFAAAVILPAGFHHPLLNDSKQMSRQSRELLRGIIEQQAVAWAVAEVSEERIDAVNILNASIEAMNIAVDRLAVRPGFLAVDGNRFRSTCGIDFRCIVKGDALYANIAAASVLAKTHRDEYMERLAREYPHYRWETNKGYPTAEHRRAIADHGLTPYHRKTFGPCTDQLSLF